jgi:HK97 gp10 family phage protein
MPVRLRVEVERGRTGFDDMIRRVDVNTGHAARTWAVNVRDLAKMKAPVRTGYLRDSITSERLGPKHWKVKVGAHYGIYVEYGTRYMAAQPYFRPAIKQANRAFKQQMKTVFR